MDKGKRIEAELQLPEAIIQHIQSFLNGKEATQTTILSKSWYAAWLTQPNLDFDQYHFRGKTVYDAEGSAASRCWKSEDPESSANRFQKFVKETIQRYERLNLRIDGLRLWIRADYGWKRCGYSLVNELITKALELGATVLDFNNYDPNREFALPYQMFGSNNLKRLSVSKCRISIKAGEKVNCSRLESLTLKEVEAADGNLIWDILSSCPLIENLSLNLYGITSLSQFPELRQLNVETEVDGPILMHQFHKLKHLSLYGVDFHPLYFDGFASKFPCLKDLTLNYCFDLKGIQIYSPTLECINFTMNGKLKVKFDVSNIRKLTFSGSSIPSLSFKTTISNWESHITIRQNPCSAKWFIMLNKLLKNLTLQSKVSLEIWSWERLDYEADIQGLSKPEVENLTIIGKCSVCPALFYSLFQCCRPNYINQLWYPWSFYSTGKKSNGFMEFVYKNMMRQVSLNCCIAYQSKSGECDLEEVSVEFYDESVSAWQPRLLDTSTSLADDEQKIRLHLRWGS